MDTHLMKDIIPLNNNTSEFQLKDTDKAEGILLYMSMHFKKTESHIFLRVVGKNRKAAIIFSRHQLGF